MEQKYNDWIECDKLDYDYRDRINFKYIVSESDDTVTYYKQRVMKIYDAEWFRNKPVIWTDSPDLEVDHSLYWSNSRKVKEEGDK